MLYNVAQICLWKLNVEDHGIEPKEIDGGFWVFCCLSASL